tara:strand:+ start:1079 stop:1312 length:234 start_codon:yes stop_codon:yes gene_type:complete
MSKIGTVLHFMRSDGTICEILSTEHKLKDVIDKIIPQLPISFSSIKVWKTKLDKELNPIGLSEFVTEISVNELEVGK